MWKAIRRPSPAASALPASWCIRKSGPKTWPTADKRVIVIGSGATAVTLVPAMARTAAHVTMLQRSPTYVVARPEQDALANFLRRHLPAMLAYNLVRWRNILFGIYFFGLCKRSPERVKKWILDRVQRSLGCGL